MNQSEITTAIINMPFDEAQLKLRLLEAMNLTGVSPISIVYFEKDLPRNWRAQIDTADPRPTNAGEAAKLFGCVIRGQHAEGSIYRHINNIKRISSRRSKK